MANKEAWETEGFSARALMALLAIQAREARARDAETGAAAVDSVEAILYRCGFANKEIVELAGTKKSTVTDRLKAAGLK